VQADADVVVVGAGPAGSAAAITLANRGRSVVLVDKAVFPRDKCCGDGLTTAALRRLESLGLQPASVRSWQKVEQVVVSTPGRTVRLPLPAGRGQFAASARRVDLDAALVALAVQAGVELVQGSAVSDVVPAVGPAVLGNGAPQAVKVRLAAGRELLARYVVAADGMWSAVRKSLGLREGGYLGDWQAGRQYVRAVGPEARDLWVWFEPEVIPGYVWSFPLANGVANVGYGVVRRQGQRPAELRGQRPPPSLLGRPRISEVLGADAVPEGQWKAWPIPARIGGVALCGLGGRVLFAGDAARACDPMTGEGIAQALETGELAALAIAAAGPSKPDEAASRYLRQVRLGLAIDDGLARLLSSVLAHRRGVRGALAVVDSSEWCRRQFVRWMFEDYPRAVLATPHRWQAHMFTRPGAFAGLRPGS
jgi:geranylgeranyl reductase family protein